MTPLEQVPKPEIVTWPELKSAKNGPAGWPAMSVIVTSILHAPLEQEPQAMEKNPDGLITIPVYDSHGFGHPGLPSFKTISTVIWQLYPLLKLEH